MRRPAAFLALIFITQSLGACSWVLNEPVAMKLPGTSAQVTPCVANNLGKEFRDGVPIVEHGNTPGSSQITINAARGDVVAFVTVEPIPSGGSTVTFYDGEFYYPNRMTNGLFSDYARLNWRRAERAILLCGRDSTSAT